MNYYRALSIAADNSDAGHFGTFSLLPLDSPPSAYGRVSSMCRGMNAYSPPIHSGRPYWNWGDAGHRTLLLAFAATMPKGMRWAR